MAKPLALSSLEETFSDRQLSAVDTTKPSLTGLHQDSEKTTAKEALIAAIEMRALDPVALHVGPHSSLAEYFVIASGTSARHVQGIADKIRERLSDASLLRSSGYDNAEWIVLDYGNVIVHVFYEPARHFYELDQRWENAEALELDGRVAEEARKLRTGLV